VSPDPSPNDNAPRATDEGIALAFRAQDDGDWKPLVDWLTRNPENAETVVRFPGGDRDVGRVVNPPCPAARAGTVLGDYELLEVLGRGRMGVVYRGVNRRVGHEVAVKVIETAGLTDAQRARVRFEVEALAGLSHKNVVPLYASGETDTELYFVMPLLAGGSLQALIARGHQLTLARVAELVRDIALGVHHAHQHGLLHRDLKPANVMLDADGNPHVADFGLARPLDATVSMGGTPAYMAPEQARGERRLTTAVDVHALGVILFELLTGQRPFAGTDVPSTLKHVIEDPAPRARDPAGRARRFGTDLLAVPEESP
jgi:serine/threonine-protein kinase